MGLSLPLYAEAVLTLCVNTALPKKLTPMGLLAGENARGLCCFNREVGAFIGVSGCDKVICGRYCIRIMWISSMESGILTL